ncbi:pyrophosphatase PpaX [Clostridium perfringens]|uniref:pyrophosphatase PpaX n=1 Tax=Clostridium perfringens TaxID=1502 RepID=UPI0013E313E7|nr:pyrophosphatase PpaX [Clostridium perfringens]MDM1005536.1 pyrophosphatase PpaX [Clostridium perfringens]MDU5250643.1 pyrophosphatase PpaX [Clostridium perfringens]NGT83880.1 pyrophosphatase PpaX [Clostridium perfringens]HAT4347616.1 pyrophosphatase PpaX [Clostridium perfringens]
MIKAVLFDLDGTLINTNDLILKSFKHTFKTMLDLEPTEEEITMNYGRPLQEIFKSYDENRIEEMINCYRKINLELHDDECKEFADVDLMLQTLKNKEIKIGVVTSKKSDMAERGAKLMGIFKYFDTFITPEVTIKHKPEGEPVLKACENLGVSPSEALMVGDSPYDILAGKNAGAKTCGVKYTALPIEKLQESKPDFYVDKPLEILELVENLNS